MKSQNSDSIRQVDLVVVIDTSPSMKDEAQNLSKVAQAAINNAKTSCPSDLRVIWLGIEGTWKNTLFKKTVRSYLTRECKVKASALRGRKRGELKSAGAQEDGARAVADLSSHFKWRPGATKAIFYLGDEALEGGGSKTEQADIESANIAIQTAQAQEVKLYTYFGTSKSKHSQGIAAEYARLATETGGEAFTDQDTLEGFSTVLTKIICSSQTPETASKPATVATTEIKTATAVDNLSQEQTTPDQTTEEKKMQLLTIDTKDNCYVIDPEGMNTLQENVSSKITLEQGNFEIQISEGSYSYSKKESEGEPFVLLWIYGSDGSTFVNQQTGVETGATWTTLNGYKQKLRLEVKQQVVLCGLFFNLNSRDHSGSVKLAIQGNSQTQELLVDSQSNTYALNEEYLSSLKQWEQNFIELEPGNYRIKIREANASYWSEEKKFKLEPWALIWIKAGEFVPQLTGIETSETWCSLNGFEDEFILEVKTKTTLSGLFFDTYKEDNEGQIIIAIENVTTEEVEQKYQQQEITLSEDSQTREEVSSKRVTVSSSVRESKTSEKVRVTASSRTTSSATRTGGGSGGSFSFRFDEAEMEQMWQQMAAKIQTSVTVGDEQDKEKVAQYWGSLEKWILKGYQSQAKDLAIQVARLEFMMKSLTQQMEVSFNENFQGWSSYFDSRLNELIEIRMTSMVEEQVNLRLNDRTTEITNQVIQQLQGDIDKRVESVVNLKISDRSTQIKNQVVEQLQGDIDKRIGTVVDLKVDHQAEEINNLVVQRLQDEMERRINTSVNLKIENQAQDINSQVIKQIQSDMDRRIDSVVNLKLTDQTPNIKNLVIQELQGDMDKRIDSVVNLKLTDQNLEITESVTKHVQGDLDKRVNAAVDVKIDNQTQDIKKLVVNQLQTDLDRRIDAAVTNKTDDSVQVVVSNVINNVDDRINVKLENRILNFRDDVTSIVQNELNQNYTESIKTILLSDIKKQQFFIDIESIKGEVNNFYSRLGQFESQLNLRIEQGDTQLYNWTLEQLTALQGCLSDRQTLSDLFESFASKLKNDLDNAPCVQPSRFKPMIATLGQEQISPAQPQQLPGS
ncbi:MAG: hypothetical protein AAF652_11275 [Cyanobacteria bacterium P01_C01_bin.72]